MSVCTTGTCPHDRGVFVWLGDGPWRGDESDPDYNSYPWVHDTTMVPGHLEVCELMPFATPAEAGEACEDCGCGSGRHVWPTGPIGHGGDRMPKECLDCACLRMRYRAVTPVRPAGEEDRLMRGEAVPGAAGACSRERCAHSALRHRSGSSRSYRGSACRSCRCPGWTDEPLAVMPPDPDVQLALFGRDAA